MGYCMNMSECRVMIKNEKQDDALRALKQFSSSKRLRWIEDRDIQNSETLSEALDEIRYPCSKNDFGDIIDLYFTGEKLGDDTEIFNTIAPYVEDGSYIEMHGEDGDRWRWLFKNGECKWVNPQIVWW